MASSQSRSIQPQRQSRSSQPQGDYQMKSGFFLHSMAGNVDCSESASMAFSPVEQKSMADLAQQKRIAKREAMLEKRKAKKERQAARQSHRRRTSASPPNISYAKAPVEYTYNSLINAQNFDGSFNIDLNSFPQFSAIVESLKQRNTTLLVIQTLIAVHILRSKHAAKKAEWSFMERKAISYIDKVGQNSAELLAEIATSI